LPASPRQAALESERLLDQPRTTKALPHVVVNADDAQTLAGKPANRSGANQASAPCEDSDTQVVFTL